MEDSRLTLVFFSIPFSSPAFINLSLLLIVLLICKTVFVFRWFADVSTTIILEPGSVLEFLKANQSVETPRQIDWVKVVLAFKCKNWEHAWLLLFWAFEFLIETWQAAKMLKHMRVKATHRNMEFKIIGLSQKPCNQQLYGPHDCTFNINCLSFSLCLTFFTVFQVFDED